MRRSLLQGGLPARLPPPRPRTAGGVARCGRPRAGTVCSVSADPESPESTVSAPFVTIRAGGPLDGVVTITALGPAGGRSRVAASWMQDGEPRSQWLDVASYRIARAIANATANQFAVGNRPTLTRD